MSMLVALALALGPRAVAVGPLAVIDSVNVAKIADPTSDAALETRRPATRRLDKGSPPPPNNGDVDIFLQVGTMRTASTGVEQVTLTRLVLIVVSTRRRRGSSCARACWRTSYTGSAAREVRRGP